MLRECIAVIVVSGEEYIKKVIESINSTPGAKKVNVDQKLLNELFLKTINTAK